MSRSAKAWTWVVAALLALAATGAAVPRFLARQQGGEVPTLRLVREPFVRRVSALGNLRAARAQPIGVPTAVPGPFQVAWVAPDGAPIRAGEPVVRFEASKVQKDLADALAERDSNRFQSDKQRAESAARIESLRREAGIARLELQNARQFQKKDPLIFSRYQIIESDIDETLAGAKEKHARENEQMEALASQSEREILGIDRRRAELKIGRAESGLSSLEIQAPYDGVLVLERNWRGETVRVGDMVWNGQPLAQIPDLSVMEAEVYVLEADAGGLVPGASAEVILESDAGTVYRGKIRQVDALAKPRLRGSPVQYFAVVLALDRTDPALMKPGARVRAALTLDARPDALTLPRQAVFERAGKTVAFKRTARGFEPVPVALGPAGPGRVVVENGLAAGDVVALADPERPSRGAPAETPAAPPPSPSPSTAGNGRP
jgi:HlyD family secretion protein